MPKLIGIGVGPGDPELLTVKAVRRLQEANLIMVPGRDIATSTAYNIASGIVDLRQKDVRCFDMPMTKDAHVLQKAHSDAVRAFTGILDEGKDIVCLTLGDPGIYSTYMYIHKRVRELGYETEIVPGIPSFCASAAALGIGLCEGSESLHIIPASYDMEEALDLPGTKVLMKSAGRISKVREILFGKEVYMVENCGMETEKKYYDAQEIPKDAGYFSLIIVKDGKQK